MGDCQGCQVTGPASGARVPLHCSVLPRWHYTECLCRTRPAPLWLCDGDEPSLCQGWPASLRGALQSHLT